MQIEETPKNLRDMISKAYEIRHAKESEAADRIKKDKQLAEDIKASEQRDTGSASTAALCLISLTHPSSSSSFSVATSPMHFVHIELLLLVSCCKSFVLLESGVIRGLTAQGLNLPSSFLTTLSLPPPQSNVLMAERAILYLTGFSFHWHTPHQCLTSELEALGFKRHDTNLDVSAFVLRSTALPGGCECVCASFHRIARWMRVLLSSVTSH